MHRWHGFPMRDTAGQPCGGVRSGAVGLKLSSAMPLAAMDHRPSTPCSNSFRWTGWFV